VTRVQIPGGALLLGLPTLKFDRDYIEQIIEHLYVSVFMYITDTEILQRSKENKKSIFIGLVGVSGFVERTKRYFICL